MPNVFHAMNFLENLNFDGELSVVKCLIGSNLQGRCFYSCYCRHMMNHAAIYFDLPLNSGSFPGVVLLLRRRQHS